MPANEPKEVLSTGILKVVVLMIVAVYVPFTGVQFPVPPDSVTRGSEDVSNPWPPLTVNTTGLAVVADAIDMRALDGCKLRAWQKEIRLVPLYPKTCWQAAAFCSDPIAHCWASAEAVKKTASIRHFRCIVVVSSRGGMAIQKGAYCALR